MKKTDSFFVSQIFGVLLLLLPVAQIALAAAEPAAKVIYFDLPGQSLQSGLIEFALQANISIVVDNTLIKGHRSSPLVGPRTIETALGSILANAPLEYRFQAVTGSYVIQKKALVDDPASAALSPAAPPTYASGVIEEVVVSGSRLPFRYHTVANSQIEGGIAYFDSSRFINILPQQLLEDQPPRELADVLKYASGITPGDGLSDTNDDVFIRGFQRHAIYLDGFRLSDSTGIKLSPSNIEQIDILKGPSTLLYGQAEPGGIINVARKKPQDETFVRVGLGVGSYSWQNANMDINLAAPIDDMNFRLVMAVDDQAEAGEINNIHHELVAPTFSWQLSSATSLDLGYEFQFSQQEFGRDFVVLNPSGSFDGATMEELAAQARPEFSSEFNLYHGQLDHYFSDEWRMRAKYFWQQEDRFGIRTSGDILTTSNVLVDRAEFGNDFYALTLGGQLAIPILFHQQTSDILISLGDVRGLYDEEGNETVNNASISLDGTFTTTSLTHHLNVGADWYRQDVYKKYLVEKRDLLSGRFWYLENIDQAFFEITQAVMDSVVTRGQLSAQEQHLLYDDVGLYIQDNIELNEKWVATLGTRYTSLRGDHTDITQAEFTRLQTYNHFSSQFGLVFKVSENNSFFMNYSESLRANYHLDDVGSRAVDPELSDQIEVGAKSLLWDGRLLSSVAFFDIDKNNIVDLKIIEGYRTALQAHQQNTRGMDLDLSLQATSRLDLIAAVSLIDPIIVSGENRGKVPALAAKQTASLFAHYQLLDNLEVNGGVSYVGERITYGTGLGLDESGENAGEEFFILDPYTTVDLGLTYHFDLLGSSNKFQLVVNNFLDEEYYTSILGGTRFNPATGRAVLARVGFDF